MQAISKSSDSNVYASLGLMMSNIMRLLFSLCLATGCEGRAWVACLEHYQPGPVIGHGGYFPLNRIP